jgi:hypothetical protein
MSVKVVTINGVSFYPTTIETEDERIAETQRMLGGAMRLWHRAFKKKWSLHWERVPEVTVSGIRTAYRKTTSVPYVDQDSITYTVITTTFKESLAAEDISLPGVYYYNIDFGLEEV